MVKIIILLTIKSLKDLLKKKFLEYAKVFKNYYGSLKGTVINNLKKVKM